MTLAIIINAALGVLLLLVVLTLLAGAIVRSRADEPRLARAARRRQVRERRRVTTTGTARPRTRSGWAARPDAS